MSTRARLQNSNDSKSLWNFTLSPGWSQFDAHILRLGLMRYGCGSWRDIGRHFPLKNCGQLNLQTQRLFGQQALAEFQKVHIDPNPIKVANDKIEGFRKNTCLINTGNNVTAKENARRKEVHIKESGIPKELYERIEVPLVLDPPTLRKNVVDDIEKLREMYRCVYDIQLRIRHLEKIKGEKVPPSKAGAARKASAKSKDDMKMDIAETPITRAKAMSMAMASEQTMDDDAAMAMALSMSMAQANIKTPAVERASRTKKKGQSGKKGSKKGSKKKKAGRKRKTCPDDGDEPYMPSNEPQRKRKKKLPTQ